MQLLKIAFFLSLIELYDGLTSFPARHETIDCECASMYDRPSLSIFAVIACLQRNYAEALSRSDVKAIVLTGIFFWGKKKLFSSIPCWCCVSGVFTCHAGAKGRFCGGFDITAFGKKPSKNEAVFP